MLLAAEGLRLLNGLGARSMEVDLSLRRALALLPRRLGGFEGLADQVELRELDLLPSSVPA